MFSYNWNQDDFYNFAYTFKATGIIIKYETNSIHEL